MNRTADAVLIQVLGLQNQFGLAHALPSRPVHCEASRTRSGPQPVDVFPLGIRVNVAFERGFQAARALRAAFRISQDLCHDSGRTVTCILASDTAGEIEKLVAIDVFDGRAAGPPHKDRQHRCDAAEVPGRETPGSRWRGGWRIQRSVSLPMSLSNCPVEPLCGGRHQKPALQSRR